MEKEGKASFPPPPLCSPCTQPSPTPSVHPSALEPGNKRGGGGGVSPPGPQLQLSATPQGTQTVC